MVIFIFQFYVILKLGFCMYHRFYNDYQLTTLTFMCQYLLGEQFCSSHSWAKLTFSDRRLIFWTADGIFLCSDHVAYVTCLLSEDLFKISLNFVKNKLYQGLRHMRCCTYAPKPYHVIVFSSSHRNRNLSNIFLSQILIFQSCAQKAFFYEKLFLSLSIFWLLSSNSV